MKRRMTLSLVLTLSVLLSLVSLPSMAQAAPPQKFSASSGVVTFPATQMLRVTVVPTGSDPIRVRFAWMKYMAAGCSGMPEVCRHTVESEGTTAVHTLNGDALSFDVPGGAPVNVTVRSNSRDVRVVFVLINAFTGEITAYLNGQTIDEGIPAI